VEGRQQGWYCVACEEFKDDPHEAQDPECPTHRRPLEWRDELNLFFRLSRYQKPIEELLARPGFIAPASRRREVENFVATGLKDFSISRVGLPWGIPVPGHEGHTFYVWFDALLGYLSALLDPSQPVDLDQLTQRGWPASLHVIGKDIVKFHAVYWPIMLKAAGLPLPKRLLVHGWWQKDGQKMSKSTGVIVDPVSVVADWGLDAFRYYVVRELDLGPDGNWTDAGFESRYNAELANGLGNLVNRALSMLKKYRGGVVPARHDELAADAAEAARGVEQAYREYRIQDALVQAWGLVNRANQYVDRTAPFKLAKDPAQAARLDEVLYNLVESCRILAVLLWPVIPASAEKIFAQLGLSGQPSCFAESAWGRLAAGHRVGDPAPLFPRREPAPTGAAPAHPAKR